MDLEYTAEELAFRDDVRAFIRERLPADIRARMEKGRYLPKEDYVRWTKILNERGWVAHHWPKKHGGAAFTPIQSFIFDEEVAFGNAPPVLPFGVSMVGPVIIAFGNEQQKAHYLPRILDGTDWWCQGFSEPGAGSDLAGLKTRAVREGDYYIVNGQKTWTTLAQHADMMFCLARTDPNARKQQEGISFLLIDMKSPGVTVRPIITIEGGHEVNEVWLDNVKVPVANLVGKENEGWTCAKYLLSYERAGIAGVGRSKQQIAKLKAIAGQERQDGAPLIEFPQFKEKIAAIEIQLMSLEFTALRVLSAAQHGGSPGAESSILKVRGSEIQQAITELLVEAVGPYALPYLREVEGRNEAPIGPDYANGLAGQYFNWRKVSIYGGSNEIQKNVIAKMILGL